MVYNLSLGGECDSEIICVIKKWGNYEAHIYDDERTAHATINVDLEEEDAELVWSNDHPYFKKLTDSWTTQKPIEFT